MRTLSCGQATRETFRIRLLSAEKVWRRSLHDPLIEDLLQREPVCVDAEETRAIVEEKSILVTGAGGSIGTELCRQIALANPRRLLLLDKSENSLFYVDREASELLGRHRVRPFLADLLGTDRARKILRSERPDIVFHAAAHKHVAMLELHPQEAIRNNVLGTRNIAEAALECGVGRFVNISTDKAVNPRNYMGLSKKLTELCIQELARKVAQDAAYAGATCFSNVRFGNVAGSTGSVLRLFWEQIQRGGPVRVTDRHATRYFMSIPEAVHLILRAAALSEGGETFGFDMGEPINIYELARTTILLTGLKPEEDVPIEFIGLQDGEKLSEELWEKWEHPIPTGTSRVLAFHGEDALARGIGRKIRQMEEFLARGNNEALLRCLHEMFPEFMQSRMGGGPRPTSAPEIPATTSLGAA